MFQNPAEGKLSGMAQVVTLNYAVADRLLGEESRPAFRWMLWLAILSGLCVGAAFFTLSGEIFAAGLHIVVFAVTIAIAVTAGVSLDRNAGDSASGQPALRRTLDLLALCGLVIVALAPVGYHLLINHESETLGQGAAVVLGLAYALMAGTTYRHLLLYRQLANMCLQISRFSMARGLVALGWVKMIYEALWLGCCAVALLLIGSNLHNQADDLAIFIAFAALFGSMGFGAVWIWMIVTHALLLRLAGKEQPRIS